MIFKIKIYHFCCVEVWSIVLFWVGFTMEVLIDIIKSIVLEQFIFSSSFNNPDIILGPSLYMSYFPWLDQERLRIKKIFNELTF